ncbi:type I-E CRISPR-associated protein Cse1/CasA [Nocardioides sp. NPDC057764]|uniref:type I-E CRISPR-associated protein Cse1/CasA n=1 Tax=Nocardioides sp. NPDC057764 TaxID=3346243 RepID=UPI0036732575
MTHPPSFDLTTQPWIQVRASTGEIDVLSLRDVFARAHELSAIAGEVPTQDAAVLRLLLAVLRRSHLQLHGTEAWGTLWQRGSFDTELVDSYLEAHRDRFDLLHPVTPFYQVADLTTSKGEMSELARLIGDVPSGENKLFTTRTGRGLERISFAEAARWLVHAQAYDPSGIKSGAVGDPRVKAGKGYPIGIGWCGWLGLVILEGRNLFETLLLNLPSSTKDSHPARDLPVWERPPHTATSEKGHETPAGPADLMTWQARRMRLGHDQHQVTEVLIANGDPLAPGNRFREEHMTSWRWSEPQTKKAGHDVFMPRAHPADRAAWRGLAGILCEGLDTSPAKQRRGRWLEWLSELYEDEELDHDIPIRMRAISMEYGPQSAVVEHVLDDTLTLSADILSNRTLRVAAVDAVKDADQVVRQLGSLAYDLVEAAGGSGDLPAAARSSARETAYAALDHPYRAWVRALSPTSDTGSARLQWQRQVITTVQQTARDLIRDAGPEAWTGRDVKRGDSTIFIDAAIAESNFYRQLRTTFSSAYAARAEGEVA